MKITSTIKKLAKKISTPALIIDSKLLKKKFNTLRGEMGAIEIYYAMKANDNPKILQLLIDEGSSFEVSSLNELLQLKKMGVSGKKIMCQNPIKSPEFLIEMNKYKVIELAFDSKDELDKIAKYYPTCKLLLRVNVPNEGSDWPLTKKFGVEPTEAIPLIEYALKLKLEVVGLTFHVGSQCLNKNNWANALYICNDIAQLIKERGVTLTMLSLGGGMPIDHGKKFPNNKQIAKIIHTTLKKCPLLNSSINRLTIEPGRGLVGDSGVMVSRVVGKARRGIEDWIYLDVGVFNGLMETIDGFIYELEPYPKRRSKSVVTVAGPSCDSVDILFKNMRLPDLNIGDYVFILNAGAYTTVYASNFNGFTPPSHYFID